MGLQVSGASVKPTRQEEEEAKKRVKDQAEQKSTSSSSTSLFSNVSALNDQVKGKDSTQKYGSRQEMADALFRDYGVEVSDCTRVADNKDLYEEMAKSYDSALDLVVDEKLNKFMREHGIAHYDTIYENQDILDQLKRETGIVFTPVEIDIEDTDGKWDDSRIHTGKDEDGNTIEKHVSHRNYIISMVDEDGNVIADEDGNMAQVLKSDMIVPDGIAQQVELFPSGFLEGLGYDCVSMIDLDPEQYKQIIEMASMDPSELGYSSGTSIMDAAKSWASDTTEFREVNKVKGRFGEAHLSKNNISYEERRERDKTGYTSGYWGGGIGSSGGGSGTGEGVDGTTGLNGEDSTSDKTNGKIAITQSQYNQYVQDEIAKGSSRVTAEKTIAKEYVVKGKENNGLATV